MTGAPLLSVQDLRVTFSKSGLVARVLGSARSIEAVAGVSFSIGKGETFALVGESGSGKTTLARTLNGLQPAASGTIRFDGAEIAGLHGAAMKDIRRRMPMMFQDPVGSLSPRLDVQGLLAEPFRIHGLSRRDLAAEARRLLALVGLPADFAHRYPHQLSGGQARRVGVARAIALEPALVIADEPTAGLDVSVQGEVLNLMNDLRDRLGLSMLIITHNLHVVRQIADRMAVMYLGRFVEQGETDAIFEAPAHPYTAALLSANPEPDPDRAKARISLPAEVPSLLARPSGCEFHTRCPFAHPRCTTEAPTETVAGSHRLTCHYPLTAPAPAGLERT
jgi:peptide/nickel transport system ATP-binding protein